MKASKETHTCNGNESPQNTHPNLHPHPSVLFVLVYITMSGTPTENARLVWSCILQGYRSEINTKNQSQLNKFELSSFVNPDAPRRRFPKLNGRGGEIKHVVNPIRHMWHTLRDPASPYTPHIDQCLDNMCNMQRVLDDTHGDMFLDDANIVQIRINIAQFLDSYSTLARIADTERRLLFPTNSKLHFLWHWGHRCAFIHPSHSSCFTDEDYMSYVKDSIKACVDGTPTHKIPARFVQKDRWASVLRNRFDM